MKPKAALPACPQCALPMASVRAEPHTAGALGLKTYRCKPCEVMFSEVDRGAPLKPERALVLNFQAEYTLQ